MSKKFETIFLDNLPTRDIAERIRKGETVYLAPGVEYPHIRYEANCLVLYKGAYPQDRVLNTALDLGCPGAYRPYFKEEIPMKIEVGKFYKDKQGNKVYIYSTYESTYLPVQYKGVSTEYSCIQFYHVDGSRAKSSTIPLIEEWENE